MDLDFDARAVSRPSREEAEEAIRTLLRWAGEDPAREGLHDTPRRVVRSYEEFFKGYATDPVALLSRTFAEVDDYDEIVLLRDIRFESHCEHHMVPIIGRAHVAYLPRRRVVGISKLARVVDVYARRLQIQERLTAQIANTINDVLRPHGVAVILEAGHQCMTTRGVHRPGVAMVTSRMLGVFRDNPDTRQELLAMLNRPSAATPFEWVAASRFPERRPRPARTSVAPIDAAAGPESPAGTGQDGAAAARLGGQPGSPVEPVMRTGQRNVAARKRNRGYQGRVGDDGRGPAAGQGAGAVRRLPLQDGIVLARGRVRLRRERGALRHRRQNAAAVFLRTSNRHKPSLQAILVLLSNT